MSKYLKVFLVSVLVVSGIVLVALWKGLDSFVFAWILNFLLMIGVLFITQTLKPGLGSAWYQLKEWEAGGKIYKWLGVNGFRKVLVWVGWEKLNKESNPVKKSPDALKHLEYSTRQSEFGHLLILIIVFIFMLVVAINYGIGDSLWLLILNIILNAYPIAVQRYNRPRLQKAINRMMGGRE
jgi:hypothetical protein